jgi:UDP-GlcNAc:undecaprenyl-phosphate/decaprenyl-phosphate GlcNAc-1-phosphate transferase
MSMSVILAFFASLITVLIITPFVIRFAVFIGAVDKPNKRKVHRSIMPRLGGLAIFIGVMVGYFVSGLHQEKVTAITIAGIVILITGFLDDKYELSPKLKLLGQLIAAIIVVSSGLTINVLYFPFIGEYDLSFWSYPITVFWIIAITNAINLIDGLDGLAAGTSAIAIATIALMAVMNGKMLILTISMIVLGSTIGFLFYNFNPAKIFMGDTGALFLGYCISILSLLGLYKSVTLFSFVVPIIILGVPIFDTTFAIIRRIVNKKPISAPDKGHLHHRLLSIGLSHRNTVLMIYLLNILFSIAAIMFSRTTLWGAILITFILLLTLELLAEAIGLVNQNYKPMLSILKKIRKFI